MESPVCGLLEPLFNADIKVQTGVSQTESGKTPASLINYVWEKRFPRRQLTISALSFAAILVAVVGYGQIRFQNSPQGETVRIAAAVLLPKDGVPISMETVFKEKRIIPYQETLSRIEAMTQDAVAQGAKLVAFNEHLITIRESEIDQTRSDFSRIAADNNIWLSVTYSWYGDKGKGANHNVLYNSAGKAVADYDKRYLLGIGSFGVTGTVYLFANE